MAFTGNWNVVSGEVATAVKFNQLGANDDYLKDAVDKSTPTATVAAYMGTSDPTGWLIANGRNVSRSTYAALFAIIGTAYGNGDGTTTFALPNFAGRTIVGVDGSTEHATIGTQGGARYQTMTEAEMPYHSHDVYDGGHNHGLYQDLVSTSGAGNQRAAIGGSGQQLKWSVSNIAPSGANIGIYHRGGSQPQNNLQPYFTANWIIKT